MYCNYFVNICHILSIIVLLWVSDIPVHLMAWLVLLAPIHSRSVLEPLLPNIWLNFRNSLEEMKGET